MSLDEESELIRVLKVMDKHLASLQEATTEDELNAIVYEARSEIAIKLKMLNG